MRLDGKTRTVLHEWQGCGHNGLALSPNKQLVVICNESNEIFYLDLDGNVLERIDAVKNDGGQDRFHFIFECCNMDDYGKAD